MSVAKQSREPRGPCRISWRERRLHRKKGATADGLVGSRAISGAHVTIRHARCASSDDSGGAGGYSMIAAGDYTDTNDTNDTNDTPFTTLLSDTIS